MSVKLSARRSSCATYLGALHMLDDFPMRTVVISGAPSAASARRARTRPVTLANERAVVRKRRRVCVIGIGNLPFLLRSRLQLAFDLVQKAPIGAFGDDLLRTALVKRASVNP